MSTDQYFLDPNHGQRVIAALNEFDRVLTRRWREEVCRGIVFGSDFHLYLRSDGSSADNPVLSPARVLPWDYASTEGRHHLESGQCAYVSWVDNGQQEDLRTVTCDGQFKPDAFTTFQGPDSGDGRPPGSIICGMGGILEQVEQWAWEERQHVLQQVPLFDHHDLHTVLAAHDTFLDIGARLGLQAAVDSNDSVMEHFTPVSNRYLPLVVEDVSSHNQDNQLWYDGWTGLAASSAKHGFFASVEPTLSNQSLILGALANLYSARAAIVNKGRNDTLYWIQWATKSLDETAPVDLTDSWVAVQGIGTGVAVLFGWSGLGSIAASVITLFGFIGQYALPKGPEASVRGLPEVVGGLNDKIRDLKIDIGGLELGYSADINKLCEDIHGVHSYNLELYDLTRNDPDKDRPESGTGGVTINVGEVLRLAEQCYDAGEQYAELLPMIAGTRAADAHLADEDGHQTLADRRLLELRDQGEEYLKTSAGRYLVAGDQVTKAVRLFVEVDTAQKQAFEDITADWEEKGVGELDPGFDPLQYAAATDHPWTWEPDGGGVQQPGFRDPGRAEYVTD